MTTSIESLTGPVKAACSFKYRGYTVSISTIFNLDIAVFKEDWPDVLSFSSVEEAIDYINQPRSNHD